MVFWFQECVNSLVEIRFLSDGEAHLEVVWEGIRLVPLKYIVKERYLLDLVEQPKLTLPSGLQQPL